MIRQRLTRTVSATSDATGAATFTLDYVPTSQWWTVTINIPDAPSSAESTATAGGSTYGKWRGSNSWGPLLIGNGEQLAVATTGLLPGEQYALQAVGYAQTEGTPDFTYPLAYADTVTTSIEDLFIDSVSDVTSYTISIPISPAWRSLWVAVKWTNAATDTITVTGDQSGIRLQSFLPPYFAKAEDQFYRYPLIAGLDSSVTLTMSSSASFSAWWGADLSDIDIATYSTIAEVLGLSYQASATGITYSPYAGVEGDGYTFTNVPSGTATVDVTIDAGLPVGEDWSSETLPSSASWNSCAISGSNAIAVVNGSNVAAYSTNGGQTWTATTLPSSQSWISVAISGSNAIAVVNGSNVAAYSTNGGQTWTATTLPSSAAWYGCAISGSNAIATGGTSTTNVAAYSTNGGQTWTATTMSVNGTWNSCAISGSNAVAVNGNTNNTAAYSTNGGQTWTASTLPPNAGWFGVGLDGSNAIAVQTGTNAAAYSTNGGQTWTATTLPSSASWNSCAISGSNAIAVADSSNVAAYSTGGLPVGGVTISCIGELSLTTYGSTTVTSTGVQVISLPVVPMVDASYYLVAPPTDSSYWDIPATTGDIAAQGAYISTTAPAPNTNIVTITYQIFTPQPSTNMTVTDSLGNTVGTISLATSPGIYTAHLSYATPTSTNLIASAPQSNAYWKIYSWVASN